MLLACCPKAFKLETYGGTKKPDATVNINDVQNVQ